MSPKFIHAFMPAVSRTVRTFKEGKLRETVISARATVAWQSVSPTEIEIGLSWCHPNDQFSRHTGRQKALGRLVAGRLHNQPRLIVKDFHTQKDGKQMPSIEGVLAAINEAVPTIPNTPRWADQAFTVCTQALKLGGQA
jgi:hypothetical protein